MMAWLTMACGSKVWIDAVIGVAVFTLVAVTTMSSPLVMGASAAVSARAAWTASMAKPAALDASIRREETRIMVIPPGCGFMLHRNWQSRMTPKRRFRDQTAAVLRQFGDRRAALSGAIRAAVA